MAHSRYGVFDPVIRKLLDSPWLYFGLAGLLLIATVVSGTLSVVLVAPMMSANPAPVSARPIS